MDTRTIREIAAAAGGRRGDALRRAQIAVLGLAALFVAVWRAPGRHVIESLPQYLVLHNAAEALSIVVSLLVFGVAWNVYSRERPGRMAVLSCGFLAVGLIDFAHMLSFKGMPDFVTPSGPEKAIDFWLAARFVAAATLLAAAARPAARLRSTASRYVLLAGSLALVALVWWIVLYHAPWLPRTFIEGEGLTPAKVGAEYLIIVLFAVAGGLFYIRSRRGGSGDAALLFAAAAVSILSELSFTLYSEVTDIFNLLGHLYKVVAYSFIYRAVFVAGVREPFEHLLAARNRLRESEERLRGVFEHAQDVIYMIGPDGNFLHLSPSFERITGWRPEEWLARSFHPIVHPDDVERAKEIFRRTLAQRSSSSFEMRIARSNGEYWDGDFNVGPLASGGETVLFGIGRDVSERKQQEKKIARLSRIHQTLSGINSLIVRVADRDELFREACHIAVAHGRFAAAWIGVLDAATQEIRGAAWEGEGQGYLSAIRRSIRSDGPDAASAAARAMRSKAPSFHNDVENDSGLMYRGEAVAAGFRSAALLPLLVEDEPVALLLLYARERGAFDDEERELLIELASDISFALDHLVKSEKVNYLAFYDQLTGLPNRAFFVERAGEELQPGRLAGEAAALVLLDVERFRNVNQSLGHHAGDALLREIGARLRPALAESTYLARTESDRFAFVVQDVAHAADVAHFVERSVQPCFARPFPIDGQELRVGVRLGIALFPGDGTDVATLYRNAEAALAKAKQSGERFLFYAPEMNARVAEQLGLENRLRAALEKGQFVLHYQPKFRLDSGAMAGLEALIRWNDPDKGLVPPGEFVPLLEETGLILPVGAWAMQQALRDFAQWAALGLAPPRIAVNVSAIQLRQADFAATVRAALGAGGHGLDLEITESVIMANVAAHMDLLSEVRAMGVRLAIDDFGTGYSSLRYISRLPVDTLKIDRSFVVNMTNSPGDAAIVSTIIALGHSLGLTIVAEGVDAEAQVRLLRDLRCDEVQGFLFSRPVSAASIEDMLRKRL